MGRGYVGLADLILCAWCIACITGAESERAYREGYYDRARYGESASSGEKLPALNMKPDAAPEMQR